MYNCEAFLKDAWKEHVLLCSGTLYKSDIDRYYQTTIMSEEIAFQNNKPEEFLKIDNFIISLHGLLFSSYIITLADNRMIMGDLRYGPIKGQHLSAYNVYSEFFKRLQIAWLEKNIEYVVDAYNMLRIQYYKTNDFYEFIDLYNQYFYDILRTSESHKWKLISVDDGIHAEKQE